MGMGRAVQAEAGAGAGDHKGGKGVRVLFVCSGNTCRSPLAEAVLQRERPGWQVASAGVGATPGAPATAAAMRAAARRGLDLTGHRSRRVGEEDLRAADVCLTMTEGQRAALAERYPALAGRVLTLADAAGEEGDVEDPYGGDDEAYDRTLDRIERWVEAAAAHLSQPAPLGRVVAAGADHAGRRLKDLVCAHLRGAGFRVEDAGTHGDASCDYPDFARPVARAVASGRVGWGVLVCGTGLGMAIAANKVRGVRAVSVSETVGARLARAHNDANVLCLGGRIVGDEVALAAVREFAATPWEGGRHAPRLAKVAALEAEACGGGEGA